MPTYRKVALIHYFVCVLVGLCPPISVAQTLDEKAYNAVWDRLDKVLPKNTPTESVHALTVIVPATWATGTVAGLRDLQGYAGAIPEDQFSIDPSRLKLLLHQVYSRFVLDVDLPKRTQAEKAAFEKAKRDYAAAFDNYRARLVGYEAEWEKRKKDLTARGEKINSRARLDFRNDMSGYFSGVQGPLDAAASDVNATAPVNAHWVQAFRAITDETDDARSDFRDVYTYFGGEGTLDAIKDDCTDWTPATPKGWEVLTFDNSINSTNIRSSGWNGGGGWGGTFFSLNLGGGGSNYNQVIQTSNENIALRFCQLSYIQLKPGAWFDPSFLQAIDSGELSIKPGSAAAGYLKAGGKILGPTGVIPRLVKGAVVARRVEFMATLGNTNLSIMESNSGGSGGIKIGPWQIGGGGGSHEFKREYTSTSGSYGRATATDVPVMLAIVTEPTTAPPPAVPPPSKQ